MTLTQKVCQMKNSKISMKAAPQLSVTWRLGKEAWVQWCFQLKRLRQEPWRGVNGQWRNSKLLRIWTMQWRRPILMKRWETLIHITVRSLHQRQKMMAKRTKNKRSTFSYKVLLERFTWLIWMSSHLKNCLDVSKLSNWTESWTNCTSSYQRSPR